MGVDFLLYHYSKQLEMDKKSVKTPWKSAPPVSLLEWQQWDLYLWFINKLLPESESLEVALMCKFLLHSYIHSRLTLTHNNMNFYSTYPPVPHCVGMDFATLSMEIPAEAAITTLEDYHAHSQVLQVMEQHTYNPDIQEVSKGKKR